jgi:two-component system nitrogen regulation response regulator NtrX
MRHDILIIDDEPDIRGLVSGILEDEGYQTRGSSDADHALSLMALQRPTLVLLDIWLTGSRLDGMALLSEVLALYPDLPVVMISGHGTIETAVTAIKCGAYDFIEKPFDTERLLLVIRRAIETAFLRRENQELRLRAGQEVELIGRAPVISQLRASIEKVAPTGSRVLIGGPAGTGKEVVARMIHARSKRSEGPFVIVNCATLSADRLENELFGIEDPELVGGKRSEGERALRKIGLLEQAHGGTLLLDEVVDMPLETQGKIVRVLQEQTFQRVGGRAKIKVDARVIAATSADLQAEIEAGQFRQDLYYRLAVVPLRVPPLTARRDDIPDLVKAFLRRAAEATGVRARMVGDDAMAALQAHDWPGNVRQLRNVVDWLLIMAPGDPSEPIKAEMLPAEISSSAPATVQWERGSEIMGLPLREARELFEREYLLTQVTRFGGNISRTANFIGMERSALHRKLKMLGVHGADRKADGAGE